MADRTQFATVGNMLEQLFPRRRMAAVVEGLLRHYAAERGLPASEPKELNDLFEQFSTFCVVRRYRQDFVPQELPSGSPYDLGVDGYAVIIRGEIYTDPVEIEDAIRDERQIDVRFIVVQAKRRAGFDGDVFGKLADGVTHLFAQGKLTVRANATARRLRECAQVVYADLSKFQVSGLPVLEVWYTSLGVVKEKTHQAKLDAAHRRLVATRHFQSVGISMAGAQELRDFYRDSTPVSAVEFRMPKFVELPKMPGVERSMIGVVLARDLVEQVLLDKQGNRRPHILDENLRDFLGLVGNPVNAEIQKTLESPDGRGRFAILNNGVTIVAPDIVATQDRIRMRGAQVVNGGQTCNVLARNPHLLDGVMVTVRVIESSNEDVVDTIIRATNRQTAFSADEMTAREPFQKHVELYGVTRPTGREVYFERRLRQYGSTKPAARVINRRHLVQAYAAMWLDVPHEVTRFRPLTRRYESELFHVRQDPLLYYFAAVAYLQIGRMLGRGVPSPYRPARFHLIHAMKLLAVGDGKAVNDEKALEQACEPLLDLLWDADRLRALLVERLLPLVDRALEPGATLADLNTAVRAVAFGQRLQRGVLELTDMGGQASWHATAA
jgi:hypothetical protein